MDKDAGRADPVRGPRATRSPAAHRPASTGGHNRRPTSTTARTRTRTARTDTDRYLASRAVSHGGSPAIGLSRSMTCAAPSTTEPGPALRVAAPATSAPPRRRETSAAVAGLRADSAAGAGVGLPVAAARGAGIALDLVGHGRHARQGRQRNQAKPAAARRAGYKGRTFRSGPQLGPVHLVKQRGDLAGGHLQRHRAGGRSSSAAMCRNSGGCCGAAHLPSM
jgi:hypothetical protein